MKRYQSVAFVIIFFFFLGSIVSIIFGLTYQYPVHRQPINQKDDFDTSFWDIRNAQTDPLEIINISDTSLDYDVEGKSIRLNKWTFTYHSEYYNGIDIRIHSTMMYPLNLTNPVPAILVLHGYGSSSDSFSDMIAQFAANDFIALAIDSPGSGKSTNYPPLNPETFFNITNGPKSAHIYHSVWSAARAITLLESLSYVNEILIVGGSMGGIEAFILSAIDSRIDGSVPLIACGNLVESMLAGSLLNSIILPQKSISSEEIQLIEKWFDPIAYARLLTNPVFMLFGTNDPFFILTAFTDTIEAITAPLTLSIHPNSGHFISPLWTTTILNWIKATFLSHDAFPSIELSFQEILSPFGFAIDITAQTSVNLSLYVCWRTGDPGSIWDITPMIKQENDSRLLLLPSHIGRVTFFIAIMDENHILITSSIQYGNAGSFLVPIFAVISGFGLFVSIYLLNWHLTRMKLLKEIPMFTGISMIIFGFIFPFYGIEGKIDLSLFDFIEVYGETLGLSTWFLSLSLALLCLAIAMSSLRHNLQLKFVIAIWMPILLVLIVSHIFFSGIFALVGELSVVYVGFGAYLLIFAIPVMLILEFEFRKYTNIPGLNI